MRLKIFLGLLVIGLVAIFSVVWMVQQSTAAEVRSFMFRGGMLGIDGTVSSLENFYTQQGSWQGVERILPAHTGGGMHAPGLRLSNAQGIIIWDSSGAIGQPFLSPQERARAIPLNVSGQIVGYLMPEGVPLPQRGAEDALLSRLNTSALKATLIAILAAVVLSFWLSNRLLKPIHALNQAAVQLAAGNLQARVPVQGKDELANLGKTFNHMAASLQQAEFSRKALTADIAHELRTPLAVQRAHLEALQDGIYPLTMDNLPPIVEQNHLLNRLVEDLRTLTLADSGKLDLQRVPTDLVELLDSLARRFQPQAHEKSIHLSTQLNSRPPLQSLDPTRMEQMLGNLIANALRHTPEGGEVLISLDESAAGVRVQVRDSGAGIPAGALGHIFDRFFRADTSRSRAEGGTGLGLTIARQLARAHGGELTAENAPQGGAIFTFSLPASSMG